MMLMLPQHRKLLQEISRDKLNYELSEKQLDQFSVFADLLIEWNEKVNLTSITDPEEIVLKHFVDSLTLGKLLKGNRVADIGTGAGFPGVPLKIMFPDLEMFLVDSLAKRLDFLKVVIERLGFTNTQLVHARAEDFGRDPKFRESFDTVTSRAVARLPVLLEYAVPLLRMGSVFLAAKGPKSAEEVSESDHALQILGAKIIDVHKFSLGVDAEYRSVIVIRKVAPTPKSYPRKAGTPAKKPLL